MMRKIFPALLLLATLLLVWPPLRAASPYEQLRALPAHQLAQPPPAGRPWSNSGRAGARFASANWPKPSAGPMTRVSAGLIC